MPIDRELKRDLLTNYITLMKMIDAYTTSFRNHIKNNDLNKYEYQLSKSLYQKEQLFNTSLAMIYNELFHEKIHDIQQSRQLLQMYANLLIQEQEEAINLYGGEENYYLKTCNDTKEKLDDIDGYIALVC